MTLTDFQNLIEGTSPFFYVSVGCYMAIGFSILGAAIGIFNVGASLVTSTIHHPEIRSKNLLSILFCEAIALYGVILGVVMATTVNKDLNDLHLQGADEMRRIEYLSESFRFGGAGTAVGLTNFAAAITVGVVGSTVTISHSNEPTVFVKLFICEIFAEAIALIGLICGIVMII